MNGDLIIINANIATPQGNKALKGDAMKRLLRYSDAFLAARDGIIIHIGAMSEYDSWKKENLSSDYNPEIFDAEGCMLLPGFVDSHTHLIFGGYREEEFSWRLKGDTYMEIMSRGGGIQSTVNATRAASQEELRRKAAHYIDVMSRMGVTTVEAKSGYGLDTPTEGKMLDVIMDLANDPERKVNVVSTFLGAHAIPTEYKGRTAEYVDHIIEEMLPLFRGKAEFCDVFCEKNVFELEDSKRLLQAAKEMGYKLKLHADEIVTLGGAEVAAAVGAVSADHLLHISDKGIHDMVDADVVATLLPLTAFALKEPFAPARKIIDAGGAVALATDLNPGSCFSGSIPLTIALACIYMDMSIEEVITALTLNGAAAVDRAGSIGSLEVGKCADMVLLCAPDYNFLPYYVGMNSVKATFLNANQVKL
jgi:imidazolonepropionase